MSEDAIKYFEYYEVRDGVWYRSFIAEDGQVLKEEEMQWPYKDGMPPFMLCAPGVMDGLIVDYRACRGIADISPSP